MNRLNNMNGKSFNRLQRSACHFSSTSVLLLLQRPNDMLSLPALESVEGPKHLTWVWTHAEVFNTLSGLYLPLCDLAWHFHYACEKRR